MNKLLVAIILASGCTVDPDVASRILAQKGYAWPIVTPGGGLVCKTTHSARFSGFDAGGNLVFGFLCCPLVRANCEVMLEP